MNEPGLLSLLPVVVTGTLALGALAACDTEEPTFAVVDNAYPPPPDGGEASKQTVVYRAWWVTSYFPDPVPGGASSSEQRSVPVSDFVFALLAPGWDPASTTPPAQLVVVKSKVPLSASRGDTLHIVVSDQTFTGSCAAGQPLSQEDADLITQSIFPAEFTGVTYDAKTCTTMAIARREAAPPPFAP
jgi:hypothetical protein